MVFWVYFWMDIYGWLANGRMEGWLDRWDIYMWGSGFEMHFSKEYEYAGVKSKNQSIILSINPNFIKLITKQNQQYKQRGK